MNIAHYLPRRAAEQPQTLALIEPHGWDRDGRPRARQLTFRELNHETDLLARGFEAIGAGRGARVVVMVKPSLEFFTITFALFKAGAVVVLIDPGMGVRGLTQCIREAAPHAFVGIPRAHLARIALGWGRDTLRSCVTVGPKLGWGGWTLSRLRLKGRRAGRVPFQGQAEQAQLHDEQLAAILFTSGSTGVAKGAVYTHSIFAAQVEMLRQMYDIRPGEVDLPTFPLFGLFAPALGMTAVIPEMDATRPALVDPRKILDAIDYYGVTQLFGSPALLRRVGEYGAARGRRLPTLRRVISAGAPVPARVIARVQEMLPDGVQVHTPYGATESLPVSTIGSKEILAETAARTAEGAGVCVGRPVEGMRAYVIPISDGPVEAWSDDLALPPGEVGEIVVDGPVVTQGYHNRPEADRLAKIHDPRSGRVLHRMGDLGYLDERGRIWFCGRKSHRVVTPRRTYFTIPCEGVFNAHPAVHRTALVGVPTAAGARPVLCVERLPEGRKLPEDELRRQLLELGARHEHTRDITTILFHDAFPVDVRHNAKIFREKLALWAARRV